MLALEFVKCWPDNCFCADSNWFDESEEPNYCSREVERGLDSIQCFSEEVKHRAHCLACGSQVQKQGTNRQTCPLVEENAKVISQMDGIKDELDKENAVIASLKSELETSFMYACLAECLFNVECK